ncbi:hypothetical protein ACOMHN_000275 [Nucella lapillus]
MKLSHTRIGDEHNLTDSCNYELCSPSLRTSNMDHDVPYATQPLQLATEAVHCRQVWCRNTDMVQSTWDQCRMQREGAGERRRETEEADGKGHHRDCRRCVRQRKESANVGRQDDREAEINVASFQLARTGRGARVGTSRLAA